MQLFKRSDKSIRIVLLMFSLFLGLCVADAGADPAKAVLVKAVMCEAIENFQPANPAVVFSMSQGEVFCFSEFDPVREKTVIYHKWYKRDTHVFTMRLTLSPPKWASFSRVQIRNEDKGPWRVEILSEDNVLLQTLRFSMAD